MRLHILSALLLLAACEDGQPRQPSNPATAEWEVGPVVKGDNRSHGVPLEEGGVWTATVEPGDRLGGVLKERGAISGSIRLRYTVEGGGLYPAPDPQTARDVTGEAAGLTPFLQRAGDNWSGKGKYGSYRFYGPFLPLTEGEHNAVVPLEKWTNVHGQWDDPALAQLLADSGKVGLGFGHWDGRMHGVASKQPVTITLHEFVIE